MKIKDVIIISIFILAVILGSWYFLFYQTQKPQPLDEFAQCLTEKGVIFYGAFWCPHCNDQKNLFGVSAKYIPYVECSSDDGNSQLQFCQDANIQAYPTWQFADGSREEGALTLERLAEKSGCQLLE